MQFYIKSRQITKSGNTGWGQSVIAFAACKTVSITIVIKILVSNVRKKAPQIAEEINGHHWLGALKIVECFRD